MPPSKAREMGTQVGPTADMADDAIRDRRSRRIRRRLCPPDPNRSRTARLAQAPMNERGPLDVSAVVPAYNGEAYIAETLSSILAQTRKAREVIVINDGSTDRTEEIVAKFGDAVTCITTPNNGVQAARDLGCETAHGKWVALCDQDDLWDPDYLESQARLIQTAPDLEFVFSNFRYLRDGKPSALSKFDEAPPGFWQDLNPRISPEGWVFQSSILGATFAFYPLTPSVVMATKTLVKAVGGFNPGARGSRNEDAAFIGQCLMHAKVAAQPRPLVSIRRHANNFSRDLVPRLLDEIAGMRGAIAQPGEFDPYRTILEREIVKRTAMAFHAAFALQDHALVRTLFASLPSEARTRKILLKRGIASVPDPLGPALNRLLQLAASGKVGTPDDFVR
jgi:glycosyltransferase involved in cell wall biosynthesis